jgi:hypothetical protein
VSNPEGRLKEASQTGRFSGQASQHVLHRHRAECLRPGTTEVGLGAVQLVAAADPSDPVTALDGVVDMERAVTRHAKHALDAQVS